MIKVNDKHYRIYVEKQGLTRSIISFPALNTDTNRKEKTGQLLRCAVLFTIYKYIHSI